ncbi:MAG: NTP transferase domain-containing protein [Clostridium fessum]
MYGSICMGLRHIQKKADRVLLFPADVPMITADTIEKMAQAPGSMAVPVCQGKKGHPVMLSKEVFGHILTYRGGKGLRGAMDAWGEGVREIEVEEIRVFYWTPTRKWTTNRCLPTKRQAEARGAGISGVDFAEPRGRMLQRADGGIFWRQLLRVVQCSVPGSIRDISYSKGWKMLKDQRRRSWESSF